MQQMAKLFGLSDFYPGPPAAGRMRRGKLASGMSLTRISFKKVSSLTVLQICNQLGKLQDLVPILFAATIVHDLVKTCLIVSN